MRSFDPQSLVRRLTHYSGTRYLACGLGAVRSAINARWLGPELYGFWGSIGFLLSFGYHLHGGVQHVLARDVPSYRSQGRVQLAQHTAQVSWSFFLGLLLIGAAAFWLRAWTLPASTAPLIRLGWGVAGLVLLLEVMVEFESVVARAEERFHHVSRALLVTTLVSLALTCWLVVSYGLSGFYCVALATPAIGLWLLRRRAGYPWRFAWSWPTLRPMLLAGWPILVMTLAFEAALKWIDRAVVLGFIGITGFGYYGFGAMLAQLCFLFPEAVALVVEPGLYAAYARQRSAADVREHVWSPLKLLALSLPVGLAGVDLALPTALGRWFPDYLPGLPAMRVLIWSSFFMGLAVSLRTFIVALGEQRRVLPLYGLAVVLNGAISIWLALRGWGLLGIALGAAVAHSACCTGLLGFAARRFGWSWPGVAKRLGAIYAPWLAMVGLTVILPWIGAGQRLPGAVRASIPAMQWGGLLTYAAVVAWYLLRQLARSGAGRLNLSAQAAGIEPGAPWSLAP